MKNLFIISFILLSCSKEQIIPKNGVLDNGQIFVVGYISNINKTRKNVSNNSFISNLGLKIYSKKIKDKKIQLEIDTGLGFFNLTLTQIDDEELGCDLNFIRFTENKTYRFKVSSEILNEVLILEKKIPLNYQINSKVEYESKSSVKELVKITDVNFNDYVFDINKRYLFSDTLKTIKDLYENYLSYNYSGENLPTIVYRNSEFIKSNYLNNDYSDYFEFPKKSTPCEKIPNINQKFFIESYKLHRGDYEYICSINDNINNIGNPFFMSYQLKGLSNSYSKKILGIIVATNISYSNISSISDESEERLIIYLKNEKNENIFDDLNFSQSQLTSSFHTKFKFNKVKKYYYLTENDIKFVNSDCNELNKNIKIEVKLETFDLRSQRYKISGIMKIDIKSLETKKIVELNI